MVLFYAEILRSVGYRDNSFKPLASNDPTVSTISWGKDAGVTANSNGDVLSLSGTDASHGVNGGAVLSTTTYPYLVIRAKGTGTLDAVVGYTSGSDTFTIVLTSSYKTFTFPMTAAKTVNVVTLRNQSVAGTNNIDYVAQCGKTPLQLSQKDLISGTVTR